MRKVLFYVLAILFLPATSLVAQTTVWSGGKQYVYQQNKWQYFESATGRYWDIDSTISVTFKPAASAPDIQNIEQQFGLSLQNAYPSGARRYGLPVQNLFQVCDSLLASPLVESASLNAPYIMHIVPNDQYASLSAPPGSGPLWYLPKTKAYDAWSKVYNHLLYGHMLGFTTRRLSDIVVAVIDGGTDWEHEDLGTGSDSYSNIWTNPGEDAWGDPNDPQTGNGIDDDLNGITDDWKGVNYGDTGAIYRNNPRNYPSSLLSAEHGTIVAGLIGAKTHNAAPPNNNINKMAGIAVPGIMEGVS